MKKIVYLPLLLGLMGATAPPDRELAQARQASQALLRQLQQALKTSLQSQGTVATIQVCQQMAPEIAQHVAQIHQVQIRRVALKTRNPANQPDAFEAALLKRWKTSPQSLPEEHAEVVQNTQGQAVMRYLKPLKIQPLCLQCHGPVQKIAPDVRALLKKKYPQDQAMGYHEGELRGAVTVQIPLK